MRLSIVAVGRLKEGGERALAARYAERAQKAGRPLGFRGLDIVEIAESRARAADRRLTEEAIAIATALPAPAVVTVLDAAGDSLTSPAFAATLGAWRDAGEAEAAFVIGGPDGLAPAVGDRARLKLAFGTLTWPHQLARIMLLEQLYRAMTILGGHPYHRP